MKEVRVLPKADYERQRRADERVEQNRKEAVLHEVLVEASEHKLKQGV